MSNLKRVLKIRTLAAASAGLGFASSVYAALVQAAHNTGESLVWCAVLLAGLICMLAAGNFAWLAARYPNAGGVQVYVRQAFGERASNTVTLMYILLAVAAGAAESYVFASVLKNIFETFNIAFLAALPLGIWVGLVLAAFLTVNLVGVDIAGRTQEVLTFTMLVMLTGFSVYALLTPSGSPVPSGAALAPVQLVQAVAYAVYLFIGFEWITPLAEETEDVKSLGKAMSAAIIALAATYSLFATGLTRHIDTGLIIDSTTPHMEFARVLAGRAGVLFMGAVSVIATFTAFNAGIMGTSRLVYAMAREGVLPRFLARVHMTFYTPWTALVTIFCLQYAFALAIVQSGSFKVPIFLAASIECVIYTLVSLAVIRLSQWKKVLIPGFTAVVFGSLTVLMMLPPTPVQVFMALAAGLLLALAYTLLAAPRLNSSR